MTKKKKLSISAVAALLLAIAPVLVTAVTSSWWAIGEPDIPSAYQRK